MYEILSMQEKGPTCVALQLIMLCLGECWILCLRFGTLGLRLRTQESHSLKKIASGLTTNLFRLTIKNISKSFNSAKFCLSNSLCMLSFMAIVSISAFVNTFVVVQEILQSSFNKLPGPNWRLPILDEEYLSSYGCSV